ncbi:MAG TPA: cell division protein [Euryarchaeota archaeon]|nr:cell division protein FtsZ [archaeon BMS3Bbin15]HDL15262.1 cell division protein [Euryarchaeota archaeon]
MKCMLIGLGQAGGKITDRFMEYDKGSRATSIYMGVAVNSARVDLVGLKNIPEQNRVLIGETIVKGHGVGADNRLGAEIARKDMDRIMNTIAQAGTENVDAFVIVSSMGGGTGSGSAPIVAKYLKKTYSENVYIIGVLPADNEGGIYLLNAARSLKTLSKYADALILVDNGVFLNPGESLKEAYSRINNEIVKRFDVLFRAGEIVSPDHVPELVVDASEIANTINGMEICTIGYASEKLPRKNILGLSSLLGKKTEAKQDKASRVLQLVTGAVKSHLLLPCDFRYVRKALVVIAGPPEELSRVGMENSKEWLETTIKGKEVRGGDYPAPGSDYIAVCVLISGLTGSKKINDLFERAKDMQEIIAKGMTEEEYERLKQTAQLMGDIDFLPLDED